MSSFDFDFRPTYFDSQRLDEFRKSQFKDTEWTPEFPDEEYLPEFGEYEVEIGCVVLSSTTGYVVSIRVKKDLDGYSYRVVDEMSYIYEPPEHLQKSKEPLTLNQIIELINDCEMRLEGSNEWFEPGLVKPIIRDMVEGGIHDSEKIKKFVGVESNFYPQLHDYYEYQKDIWYQELKDEWDED